MIRQFSGLLISRTPRYFEILSSKGAVRNVSFVEQAHVRVSKNPSLADEPVSLWIEGLRPNQKVTLHASVRLSNGAVFESASHYVANDQGAVNLEQDASQGGLFTGIEPMGSLSFMMPSVFNKIKWQRFLIKDPTKPFTVNFRVLDSFVGELQKAEWTTLHENPPDLALTRLYMAPGVQECPVWVGRVRGTLFLPAGRGPFPGVISMSGGYPGAMKHKAALLASHGFAALALKYYGEDDLPDYLFGVDLEYFEEAAVFLKHHPRVDGKNGVGIIANCYGGNLGLGLASLAPKGLIKSVVSVGGWSLVFGSHSYKGEAILANSRPDMEINVTSDGITEWKYLFSSDIRYREPLEFAKDTCYQFFKRHNTAYMLVSGGKDPYFEVDEVINFHRSVLRDSGHAKHEVLYYSGAGHLIEHSFYPFCGVSRLFGERHNVGGEQPHHSEAQIDSWPRILEFTLKNLTRSDGS